MKLKGKVAIVTGGAQGIGKSYALCLLGEGAKVVIADIIEPAWISQAKISGKDDNILAVYTDVSEEESTMEMARKTVERFGGIDILINNAAISAGIKTKPFYEISAQEWDKVIRVNLKGTFLCCKAVYPQMKKQGKGKIINISSGVFFRGVSNFLHYVASKGGVIALTRSLARELGDDGICVNAIAPGFTLTHEMKEKPIFNEEIIKALVSTRCFKRDELPEDLTGTLLFLSSEESDFITGQTIVVDGGGVLH